MGIKGGFGHFLLRRASAKSVRQRHATGPMYNHRRYFHFPKGVHQMHLSTGGARQLASPTHQPEHTWHRHLPGDARRRPSEDFTFSERADKAMYAWQPRGRLRLHQIGGKPEVFVCYRCGYPVRSRLQVVKDNNWDWRMCYRCYTTVVGKGMEDDT